MKKSRNRFGKRLPLLNVLTLVVGVVIIIKWVDTMSVNRIGPKVTIDEEERRTASLQHLDKVRTPLNSTPLEKTGVQLVPIERAIGDRFDVIQVGPLRCFPDPVQTCPELYSFDENGVFNPEKLLASGPLYTNSEPPFEEQLAWWIAQPALPIYPYRLSNDLAIRYSRTVGTDINALNLLMDSAALAIESLWEGTEYWEDAMSNVFPTIQGLEFLNTAPAEVLEAVLPHIKEFRASLPRPSDIARNIFRQYDSKPAAKIPLLRKPGFEPVDDSLAAWMYSLYVKQNAFKKLNERLDMLEPLIPDYLAYLDDPYSKKLPEEILELLEDLGVGNSVMSLGSTYIELLVNKINAFELRACLELYQRRHGKYPDKLSDLIPDYLHELPPSPIHNRQYEYNKEANGFEIGTRVTYANSIAPDYHFTWFASVPWPFQETEIVAYREFSGTGYETTLPIPNTSTLPSHFFGAGPFTWDEEPAILPLLEAPPTREAFETRVGAPAFLVPRTDDDTLFHLGDRFNIPRGRAYYLRTTIHSEQEIQVWIRASSTATMQIWCSRELPQLQYISTSINREFPYGVFHKMQPVLISCNPISYSITLKPGDTPILIRLMDYIGDPMFRFAIQGENGELPEGVWFK